MSAGDSSGLLGHEQALATVRGMAADGRLAHALLVTGQDGVGKTTFALALAADLVCLTPLEDGRACGECRSCELSRAGTHPDVLRVAPPKEETTIGQMRELRYIASLAPNIGPRRVFIVERAETLNEQAANATLKVLEDAPARLLLLLLAPSAKSVLATIRSRSIEIPLKGVARERIREFLAAVGVDEAGAGRLADYAVGAPGRAIRLSGNQDLLQILAGVRGWTDALLAADMRAALRLASELSSLAGRARKHLPGEDGASERQALAWVLDAVMAEWQSRLGQPLPAGWTASDLARGVDAVNRARWLILAYAQADLQLEQMVISVIARRSAPSASNATRQPRSASN